jgi:AcrR family transcriptional regulator
VALPTVGGAPPLRADAKRNRERVICAAARVVERDGAANLTMESVADEAGVGKGTVFRRFGDRSSLLRALVDEEERRLQDAVLSGPPPLGPGAPPLERLLAFGDARLEYLIRHGELLSAAELRPTVAASEHHPVMLASRFHVIHLLRLAGHGPECAGVLSSALLSFLSGSQVHHLTAAEGHDEATLRQAWRTLATGVMADATPQAA